jgi:mRNA interferase MazF
MKKGDIVLVPFPFTDLKGIKNRPAVVLIAAEDDVTVAFITTQVSWQEEYDILLPPTKDNGLKKSSLIRLSKITTIEKDLVLGRLGSLKIKELVLLNTNLIKLLQLG